MDSENYIKNIYRTRLGSDPEDLTVDHSPVGYVVKKDSIQTIIKRKDVEDRNDLNVKDAIWTGILKAGMTGIGKGSDTRWSKRSKRREGRTVSEAAPTNIVRGLDRAILVVAIIAVVPGFIFGWMASYDQLKTMTPEYIAWSEGSGDGTSRTKPMPTTMYEGPKRWHQVAGGLICSILTFLAVFSTLLGLARGLRWLTLWIAAGFRDEDDGSY